MRFRGHRVFSFPAAGAATPTAQADGGHRSPLPPEVIRVVWVDSSVQNTQVDRADLPQPEQITSVGFVLRDDAEVVVLARDSHPEDTWRGSLAIPRCCVDNVEVIG